MDHLVKKLQSCISTLAVTTMKHVVSISLGSSSQDFDFIDPVFWVSSCMCAGLAAMGVRLLR
jgi:hypothetical protein